MTKRLWCVLLTAVMLLNLLPASMADNEEPVEPLTAEEMQQEVQEVIEETLPAEAEIQPEEPEEEAAEEALPKEEETEPVEELPEGTLELLTDGVIPEIEELPEEELSEELEAAEVLPEDEEIAEEEDGGEENRYQLNSDELKKLGIDPNLTVYELTSSYRRIRGGTYTITQNVVNGHDAYINDDVTIILPDNLTLTFDFGLQMAVGKTLTITTPPNGQHNGTLVAHGHSIRPGIGGWNDSLGTGYLTIESGIIIADSKKQGAGLDPEVLTVNGGTVTATGSPNCAGIGGANGNIGVHRVIINKGHVTARGGENAAGIGGGNGMGGGKVLITGGTVEAYGGTGAAGIGGGKNANAFYDYYNDSITITGGEVTAQGGFNAAGIGGGENGGCGGVNHRNSGVRIEGGKVTATGGGHGAGIGTGYQGKDGLVGIRGGVVTAQGGGESAGLGGGRSGSCEVIIEGGEVTAIGGSNGPGIGSGYEVKGGSQVVISYGKVTANGGAGGAGIGGGGFGYCDVFIQGGEVTATGGRFAAGIGGGNYARGGNVLIYGGTVTATGGTGGSGIGGGNAGDGGRIDIRGGIVKVTGGQRAAGIGGGHYDNRFGTGIGGDVTISGSADVWVKGGFQARAIGSGHKDGPRTVGSLSVSPDMNAYNLSDGTRKIDDPSAQKLDSIMEVRIGKLLLDPQAANHNYNGREQSGCLNPQAHTRIEGTAAATKVGNYAFTVIPEPGYTWFDYTNTPKTLNWSIARARATVRANDLVIIYGQRVPELKASVRGTLNGDRLNYQISRQLGTNAGEYEIMVSGESIQGNYDVNFENGTLTIRPKDVSAIQRAESQEIPYGSGEFTEPVFRDRTLNEPIPGKLTYFYNGGDITKEELTKALAALPGGSRGTIRWRYEAEENFTGTINGSINFTITGGVHVHSFLYISTANKLTAICQTADCPLPRRRVTLTLNEPANLVYDGSAKEVSFAGGEAEAWKAATGSDTPAITYTADRGSALTGGKAVNAGSYTAGITVNGSRASVRFTIARAEYTGVIKEASGTLNAGRGSKVTITLPALPSGARYGTPVKPGRFDPYTLSPVSGNRITVTSTGIPEGAEAMRFTVPVLPDGNHTGYTVTVTLNVVSPKVNVTVKMDRRYIWTLLGRVPVNYATITADSPDTRITRIEHSLTGLYYVAGNQLHSRNTINRFFIRLTDANGVQYYFEYQGGNVIRR